MWKIEYLKSANDIKKWIEKKLNWQHKDTTDFKEPYRNLDTTFFELLSAEKQDALLKSISFFENELPLFYVNNHEFGNYIFTSQRLLFKAVLDENFTTLIEYINILAAGFNAEQTIFIQKRYVRDVDYHILYLTDTKKGTHQLKLKPQNANCVMFLLQKFKFVGKKYLKSVYKS